jgi:hypothetical protein
LLFALPPVVEARLAPQLIAPAARETAGQVHAAFWVPGPGFPSGLLKRRSRIIFCGQAFEVYRNA